VRTGREPGPSAYHDGVIALACTLTGLLALGVGVVIGLRLRRRAESAPPPVSEPGPPAVGDLLQRVFRSTDAGLAVVDRDGVVLHNGRAEELGVVVDGRADARAVAAGEQVLRSGRPTAVDLSPLGKRGRPPTSVLAQVKPLGHGCILVEAADTSEAVRLEATRRDFVANVSHELKTPVGAMGVLAEAVLDAADDPDEVRRFGTKILNESARLGNLVTELIALSRLTGAERLPEPAVVDVDEIVRQALCRSRIAGEAAGVEFIVDAPSGLTVAGDRTLLVTALSNLVDNAIAYSPVQASVSVSRRRVGNWAEIAVTDRGIGIAPEHQERVFERFFRVDPARSRATGGTGLGLAIVKHVVNNHGGEVRLWSSPGTGSTFTMRLPLHGAARDPGPPAEPVPGRLCTGPDRAARPAWRQPVPPGSGGRQ
jgi:two-component system, OmpR family, sensor histidine kinase SenX3